MASSAAQDAIQTGWREALRERVERFAGEFFSLPPDLRRAGWQSLMSTPRGSATVDGSAHGVNAAWQSNQNGSRGQPSIYPSSGGNSGGFRADAYERAVQRNAFLAEHQGERARWEFAARALERDFADIAILDPPLVASIVDGATAKR